MKVRAEQIQEQAADHFPQLVRNFEGFQTAQGINYSLSTFTNSWPRTVSPLTVPPFSPISSACFCAPSPKLTPTPPPVSSTAQILCTYMSPSQPKSLARSRILFSAPAR